MDIKDRDALILAAIIKEYINNGEPVGSREIAENYNLGVSAATIRNAMSRLEKDGYLTQPHTSAGRIPTDKGYKIFVQELMRRFELSEKERRRLKTELLHLKQAHEELGRSISKLIAETTNQAAFTLLPEATGVAGTANLVGEFDDHEELKEAVSFLEDVEDHSKELLNHYFKDEPEVLIGREMKLTDTSNYTLMMTGVKLPGGQKGLIGIVGPKRMKYDKNLSVLEYVAKLLGTGMAITLVVNNII